MTSGEDHSLVLNDSASELNTDPPPLRVEGRLAPLETDRARTLAELANHGYRRGEQWDRVYELFARG